MMNTTTQKVCAGCGIDVSQQKRVKDAAGNYYCDPCVQKARQRKQSSAQGAPPADAKVCQNCGTTVGALQKLAEWKGHQVCTSCRDTLEFEARDDAEKRQRQAEEGVQRAREAEEARLAASRMAKDADRQRYKMLLRILGCIVGGLVMGATAIAMSHDKDPLSSNVEGAVAVGCLIFTVALVVRYKRLAARSFNDSLKSDLLPSLALLGRRTRYGAVLFGLMGVLVIGVWGGVKLSVLLFGESGLAWGGGLVAGGVSALSVILPIGRYLDAKYCPNCCTLNARIERVEFLGQKAITTHTHETATVHEGYNIYGPPAQTFKVPVTRTTFINRYRRHRNCAACGHRWTT